MKGAKGRVGERRGRNGASPCSRTSYRQKRLCIFFLFFFFTVVYEHASRDKVLENTVREGCMLYPLQELSLMRKSAGKGGRSGMNGKQSDIHQ